MTAGRMERCSKDIHKRTVSYNETKWNWRVSAEENKTILMLGSPLVGWYLILQRPLPEISRVNAVFSEELVKIGPEFSRQFCGLTDVAPRYFH